MCPLESSSARQPAPGMISVIIPTYNEAPNIADLLTRLRPAMAGLPHEIVVVDDDSPDGTGRIVEELKERFPMTVLHRVRQRGLASAVLAGFAAARGEILVCMDADLSHPPEVIPLLAGAIAAGAADIAVASRLVAGGGIVGNWPLRRKLNSHLATLLARGLTGVRDPMSGFFALRRAVIRDLSRAPRGYKICLEILVRGTYGTVVEIPYLFDNRTGGRSKMTFATKMQYLLQVADLYRYRLVRALRHGWGQQPAGG